MAPGLAVPATSTVAVVTWAPSAGAVTSTAATAGGRGWYRCRTIAGCSTGRRAAQAQGQPDLLGLRPGQRRGRARRPAVDEADRRGGRVACRTARPARSGFSQACSGTSPTPEENRCIPSSSAGRGGCGRRSAAAARPARRSAPATGGPEPLPPVGHGFPRG